MGITVIALAVTAGGFGASLLIKSPAQVAAEAGPPSRDVLTAPVEHRVLVSSLITRGQVVAGQTVKVAPQISGAEGASGAVITKVPTANGSAVKQGQVLLEVAGRPVFALRGRVPVYRDLRPGATGKDVTQLQESLRDLGHPTGGDPEGTFGPGTKAALAAFYEAIGYSPRLAEEDGGAALKAAKGAVKEAERALNDARQASPAEEADAGTAPDNAVDRAQEDLSDARREYAEAESKSGPMLPAGEVVFLDGFPARVSSVQGRVGDQVTGTAMVVSSGRLLVEAYVPEYQKGLLRAGQSVEIYSELSSVTAAGKVTSVADTIQNPEDRPRDGGNEGGAASSSNTQSGYLIRVTPDNPLDPQLTGQDVRLTVEAASTDGKALVVPITAITASADGKTVVTVVNQASQQRRVEVRPGTSGDGYVAVEPVEKHALKAGDRVVTGIDAASPAAGRGAS